MELAKQEDGARNVAVFYAEQLGLCRAILIM